LHPETKPTYAGGAFKGNQHSAVTDNLSITNFASATADATGKDERTIRRAAARGEAIRDDLGAVTGTSLDKGVELDALAKLPKDERKGPKITAVDDGRAEITLGPSARQRFAINFWPATFGLLAP